MSGASGGVPLGVENTTHEMHTNCSMENLKGTEMDNDNNLEAWEENKEKIDEVNVVHSYMDGLMGDKDKEKLLEFKVEPEDSCDSR